MKKLVYILAVAAVLTSCGGETKPTSAETKAVEDQVAKDQAAMDSMEKVIQQQIEAAADSLSEEDTTH